MQLIPAIDLRHGHVVRLRQGDFARSRRFDVDALAQARRYADAGARLLHVVDLDGARDGLPRQLALLEAMAEAGLAVQWGGGLRTAGDVAQALDAGARRVVVGSAALDGRGALADWIACHGAERVVLALDLRHVDGRWLPASAGWRRQHDIDVEALLDGLVGDGLVHVLSTDIGRDGMATGPGLELYRWTCARWPGLKWIASGGVRDGDDVAALAALGVDGCVVGSALLDGSLPLSALTAA